MTLRTFLIITSKYHEGFVLGVFVMIEVSAKEAAILKLYKKHRNELLSHVNVKDLPKDYFDFDNKNFQAKLFSRFCDLN